MESGQATRCEKQERSGVGEGEKQSMRLSVSYQCGDDRPITDAQYTLGLLPELWFLRLQIESHSKAGPGNAAIQPKELKILRGEAGGKKWVKPGKRSGDEVISRLHR